MACTIVTRPVVKRLTTYSTSNSFEPFTAWVPAVNITVCRGVVKVKSNTGTFKAALAVQYAATRTDNPGDWSQLDATFQIGNGERCTGNQTVQAGSQLWVRFGVAYANNSGTSLGQGDVSLEVSYETCGELHAAYTFTATADEAEDVFEAVTAWVPARSAVKVKAVLLVTGVSGNLQTALTMQTATTSVESPSGWSTTLDTLTTGAREANLGEITTSIGTGEMWVRFGIRYRLSAAGSVGTGTVTVVVVTQTS